jgi:DNA-binding transcriptional regulator LsrR (DeoR family)
MSLLGGSVETRFSNPVEFAWRVASTLNAECYLFPAPLVVNSAETKRVMIEECGLEPIFRMAQKLDLAVVSAGDIGQNSTSLVRHLITAREHRELIELGCVGDVMCNFLDADGNLVAHPLNDRVMSISLDTLQSAGHIVLASGGEQRVAAIHAAIKNLRCNTLVTDELAARALLKLAEER